MVIKILGSGCAKCGKLTENVKAALNETNKEAEIIKVTEFEDMMSYGIMQTPALVIDEEVISVGKVLKPKEIIKVLEGKA